MSYIKENQLVLTSLNLNGMTVYPVTHNLVDLFWGEGWDNQARFKFSKGEWVLWRKTTSLPKDFINVLDAYRKESLK